MFRNHGQSDPNSTGNPLELFRTDQSRRIEHMRDACADKSLFLNQAYKGKPSLFYYFSPEYNFSYCKVPKVGCTFWTQVFTILREGTNVTDHVFGMARSAIHNKLRSRYRARFTGEERRRSRSILVSRNPYSRLFSAFVDKVFLPISNSVTVNMAIRQRDNPKNGLTCASNVTFQGFLKDIVETAGAGEGLNRHWAPIVALCDPCNVNAFSLIKQESFSTDVEYTLKELNVAKQELQAIHDALYDRRIEATIPGIIETYLKKGSRNNTCLTKLESAKRLWASFQIQGYLKDDIPFPSEIVNSEEKAKSLDFLTDLVIKTIRDNPMTSQESKTQRHRALIQAFESVDEKTIEDLKEIYKQDFILFNYSFEAPSKQKFKFKM